MAPLKYISLSGFLLVAGGRGIPTDPMDLVDIQLTSGATSDTYDFTVGQVFVEGDIPAGQYVTCNASVSCQGDIRNFWSDGSAKYAVLSGRAAFTQSSPLTVSVQSTGSDSMSGSDVSEPTTLDVSVIITSSTPDFNGTYTLQSAIDGADMTSSWNKSTAGLVRSIPGPVMSEFHYYVPTSDAHIAIWFYVRSYASGATEVETVLENNWWLQSSPGTRTYTVAVDLNGGSDEYSAALTHPHRQRWSRVDWVSTDPQIVPAHDGDYLKAAKMVPNFGEYGAPSAATLNNLDGDLVNPVPFTLEDWPDDPPATGTAGQIGLMTHWDSLYVTTNGDSRAYTAVVGNARAHGIWAIHHRDETTGRLPICTAYPTHNLEDASWGTLPPISGTGTNPIPWEIPHHGEPSYVAYLVEGRWSFLEELQFTANRLILGSRNSFRKIAATAYDCVVDTVGSGNFTTRSSAWAWRTIGMAAAITPTELGGAAVSAADDAYRDSLVRSVNDTVSVLEETYIDGTLYSGSWDNTLGVVGIYDGDDEDSGCTNSGAGQFWGRSWMHDFQLQALGLESDLEIEGVTSATLATVRDHAYEHVVRKLGTETGDGTGATGWNFRRAANYNTPYHTDASTNCVPNPGTFFTNGEAYDAYLDNTSADGALSANVGDSLKAQGTDTDMVGSDGSNDHDGYWSILISALSYAVDHGKTGAAEAWSLVSCASNFDPGGHGGNNTPNFAIVPRAIGACP